MQPLKLSASQHRNRAEQLAVEKESKGRGQVEGQHLCHPWDLDSMREKKCDADDDLCGSADDAAEGGEVAKCRGSVSWKRSEGVALWLAQFRVDWPRQPGAGEPQSWVVCLDSFA